MLINKTFGLEKMKKMVKDELLQDNSHCPCVYSTYREAICFSTTLADGQPQLQVTNNKSSRLLVSKCVSNSRDIVELDDALLPLAEAS